MAEDESLENIDGRAEPAVIRTTPPLWCSARFTYTICAFLAMLFHMCMRNILNFVILYMVQHEEAESSRVYNATNDGNRRNSVHTGKTKSMQRAADILWTRPQEFILMGSFYYGYIIILPIAGRLADKFGGKLFFVHSLTIQAVVFMLMPFFARRSFIGAVIVRVAQGLISACGNPALYQLFSTWAHPSERTAFLSIAYTGFSAGSILIFPVSSFLCKFGWEFVFYAVGSVSFLFGVCCQWLVYSNLEDHPRLSKEEYDYLRTNRVDKSVTVVPWKSILTSVPVYAFIFTHCCHSYGDFVFTLLIPRYFKEAMHLPLNMVGLLSSAPYLGTFMSKALSITFCNILEKRQNMNLTLLRRVAYVLCNCVTIILIFGMILSNCQDRLTVVLFATFIGFSTDMGFSGVYWPSLLYLAPTHAGFISGLANCLATINGFLAPLGVSSIVRRGTKDEWNVVLASLMTSFLMSAIVFGLFGSSKLAKWGGLVNMTSNKNDGEEN